MRQVRTHRNNSDGRDEALRLQRGIGLVVVLGRSSTASVQRQDWRIPTHGDEYDRAELEAYELRQAELRVIQAEARAKDEALAREQAEARAQHAQAEIQRLRTRLDALRRPDSQD